MKYQINDEELIYMIRENDEEAWNIIMEKYEPKIPCFLLSKNIWSKNVNRL